MRFKRKCGTSGGSVRTADSVSGQAHRVPRVRRNQGKSINGPAVRGKALGEGRKGLNAFMNALCCNIDLCLAGSLTDSLRVSVSRALSLRPGDPVFMTISHQQCFPVINEA